MTDEAATRERKTMAVPPRYRYATRLNSVRAGMPGQSVIEAIKAVGRVPGAGAIELNAPQHLDGQAPGSIRAAVEATGLPVTALNLRFEGERFRDGAFTNPDRTTRQAAIDIARAAVEGAVGLGADHVIVWLADDGFDTPGQVDYRQVWDDAVDGVAMMARHDPSVRVSIEYKPREPRAFSVFRTMGDALLAARQTGSPNVGVTLDVCHALMTGEYPAMAATLALAGGKLFGVHLNDGHGRGDDGLPVGSVNPWATLDLLLTLRDEGYEGTIYFDTFPVREDPLAEFAANIATVERFEAVIDRLDRDALRAARAAHDALAVADLWQAASAERAREIP
ncbi:MAG: TIM barrel protein [Chloroflexia bacterium]|nr:TIM barrel protein [Chloroflexia bacterium]